MVRTKKKNHPGPAPFKIEGLPVRNLKHSIRLVINEDDCRRGNKREPGSCAAALAAKRLPKCLEARIHLARVFLKMKDGDNLYWLRGQTPLSLRTEIATFDRGGTFEPGIYNINPLSKSQLPTGIRRGELPKPKKGRVKKRRIGKYLTNVRGNGHAEYGSK